MPALPLSDTVKRIEGGLVAETLDRETRSWSSRHRRRSSAAGWRLAYAGDLSGATDCASLVERAGGRIAVVAGDPRLVKVTTADDLELVTRLLGRPTSRD